MDPALVAASPPGDLPAVPPSGPHPDLLHQNVRGGALKPQRKPASQGILGQVDISEHLQPILHPGRVLSTPCASSYSHFTDEGTEAWS